MRNPHRTVDSWRIAARSVEVQRLLAVEYRVEPTLSGIRPEEKVYVDIRTVERMLEIMGASWDDLGKATGIASNSLGRLRKNGTTTLRNARRMAASMKIPVAGIAAGGDVWIRHVDRRGLDPIKLDRAIRDALRRSPRELNRRIDYEALHRICRKRKITLSELAERIGVSRITLWQYRSTRAPIRRIVAMAQVLDVTPAEISIREPRFKEESQWNH